MTSTLKALIASFIALTLSGCMAMQQPAVQTSQQGVSKADAQNEEQRTKEDLALANNDPVIDEYIIQNSPVLPANRIITISATGLGVPPTETISPAQAIALAKRAAMVDAYRQLGEKMFGLRINATDTIEDMASKSSIVKTKVLGVIKNARIVENTMKDGLCQVTMEVKLDGAMWHRILSRS